jgi:hypothetical protein
MNDIMNVIAHMELPQFEENQLVAYRLVVPPFIKNRSVDLATHMVNDLTAGWCLDAWVLDKMEDGNTKTALKSMDWEQVEVLEYDWDEKDNNGIPLYSPYEIWQDFSDDPKVRCKCIEPLICGNLEVSEAYAKGLAMSEWSSWEPEELQRNSCWLFYYAKNVCKGRLPEVLDNAMNMLSFQNPDDPWVKRYFGTKRYRIRNMKALAAIPWAA